MRPWASVILEAAIYAATLFIAHGLWPNEKLIEPAMARGSKGAYVAGFGYYTFALAIAVLLTRKYFPHSA